MRIRVQIDVRKPLKIDYKVKDKEGEWCIVKFKYEKLGIFCFVCGIMGHAENKCEVLFAKEHGDGVHEWSSEIRADLRRQGGRITSKWLREETGGRTEQGSMSSDQSSFPASSSYAGPAVAELASFNHTNFHNRFAGNQTDSIARQHQSSAFNGLSPQPINHSRPDPTPINPAAYPIFQHSHIPNNQAVIPKIETARHNLLTQSFNSADNINQSSPTVMPFLTSNNSYPLILNKPETETNKTPLLPYQTLTFNSQPINSAQKTTDLTITNPTPKPGPT
jgi:hypothetical protein